MKQHINLFNYYYLSGRDKLQRYGKIKKYIVYSLFIVLIAAVVLQVIGLEIKKDLKSLDDEQELILADTVNTRNNDAGLDELIVKKKLIQEYLKDDVQFNTYYRLVQGYISSQTGAQLGEFSLDKDRTTTIGVKFSTYEDYKTFMQSLEDGSFIMNFETLTLTSIPFESVTVDTPLVITFSGLFKEINEKKT